MIFDEAVLEIERLMISSVLDPFYASAEFKATHHTQRALGLGHGLGLNALQSSATSVHAGQVEVAQMLSIA